MFSKSSLAIAGVLVACLIPGSSLAQGQKGAQKEGAQKDAPVKPTVTAPGTTAPKAEPTKKVDVKALTLAGEKKFKDKDYKGAIENFEQVMVAKPSPAVARYIGLSHDFMLEYRDAAVAYEKYLETTPTAKEQKAFDEVKARLAEIKAMPATIHFTSVPPGATVTVDGKPEAMPTPVEIKLAPGAHKIGVSAEGRESLERDLDVTYASKQEITVELVEKAPPPPPPVAELPSVPVEPPILPPPAPEPRSKIPAFVTGGIAIVAAGVGAGFGIAALGKKSDFDKNPTADTADSGENAALVADMAFGVAITFGVTSLVLFLSDGGETSAAEKDREKEKAEKKAAARTRFTAAPIISRDVSGAAAGFRF